MKKFELKLKHQNGKTSIVTPIAFDYTVTHYNKPLYDEESDRTLLDIIMEGNSGNPEEMIINQENLGNIHRKINEVLSGLEQEVLAAYLDGKSYQEIAETLGRHVKSIDNALQRVKRKLEKYLEENGCF